MDRGVLSRPPTTNEYRGSPPTFSGRPALTTEPPQLSHLPSIWTASPACKQFSVTIGDRGKALPTPGVQQTRAPLLSHAGVHRGQGCSLETHGAPVGLASPRGSIIAAPSWEARTAPRETPWVVPVENC